MQDDDTPIERPLRAESITASIPQWLLEITNHIRDVNGKNRSSLISSGIKKTIIGGMRIGQVANLMKSLYGITRHNGATTSITFDSIPDYLPVVIKKHCDLFGYFPNDLCRVAIIKYIVSKDDSEVMWDQLYDWVLQNDKDAFKGILL